MALSKEIALENGIIVNYHRIVSVNNITNQASIIEIASYTNKEKREEEKEKIENNAPMNIYINTKYLNIEYNENLDIKSAYEYIKNLKMFEHCEND